MKLIEVPVVFQHPTPKEAAFEVISIEVSVGSTVEKGDALAIVETDKATVEILLEKIERGVVREICLEAGKSYAYGAILCKVEETQ